MSHAFLWFLSLISARTAIVLFVLLFGLRLAGKRQIGQMNIYDLAMVMAVANAVQNAMTNGNGNLSVGMVSSGTLLLIGAVLARLFVKLPKLEEKMVGTPTLLVSDGQILTDRMRRERVTESQLLMALHAHGLTEPAQVLLATLEVDGSISIVPKGVEHGRLKPNKKQPKTAGPAG